MRPEPIPLRVKLYGNLEELGSSRFCEGDRHLHLAYDHGKKKEKKARHREKYR